MLLSGCGSQDFPLHIALIQFWGSFKVYNLKKIYNRIFIINRVSRCRCYRHFEFICAAFCEKNIYWATWDFCRLLVIKSPSTARMAFLCPVVLLHSWHKLSGSQPADSHRMFLWVGGLRGDDGIKAARWKWTQLLPHGSDLQQSSECWGNRKHSDSFQWEVLLEQQLSMVLGRIPTHQHLWQIFCHLGQ